MPDPPAWQTIADLAAALLLADRVRGGGEPRIVQPGRAAVLHGCIAGAKRRGVRPRPETYMPSAVLLLHRASGRKAPSG